MKSIRSAVILPLFAALFTAPCAPGAGFEITPLRLSERAAVFYGGPWNNAIVAVATQKGIVVVDAPFSKTISCGFREAIEGEFQRGDFACLINTHEEICHVGGNEAFQDIPIIGHVSLRDEMLRSMQDPARVPDMIQLAQEQVRTARERTAGDPVKYPAAALPDIEKCWSLIEADARANPAVVPPTITFDRAMTLHCGDATIRLIHYGRAHSISDIIVSIPEEKLVLTGGIFRQKKVPITTDATEEATPEVINNWFGVMHGLLKEAGDGTRFIAGHGRNMYRKEQYEVFVHYLETLWNDVRRLKAEGKTLEEVKAALPLADNPDYAGVSNSTSRGTRWEIPDIHVGNIEHFWNVLSGCGAVGP